MLKYLNSFLYLKTRETIHHNSIIINILYRKLFLKPKLDLRINFSTFTGEYLNLFTPLRMTDLEYEIAAQDKKFAATIDRLRKRNFGNNLPFLILSDQLPEGQGFYEFADGRIEIQEVYTIGAEIETKFIRRLTDREANVVREKFMKENGLL